MARAKKNAAVKLVSSTRCHSGSVNRRSGLRTMMPKGFCCGIKQQTNKLNDLGATGDAVVCRMLHQIFLNDFNGCQRVSAAPCNMYATYGAGFSTVHNLGRTFGILRGESCVSQTAHLNSIPSSTISRSADSLLKRCGWERVGQLPLPGVQVGGFSRRLCRQVQKETMSL